VPEPEEASQKPAEAQFTMQAGKEAGKDNKTRRPGFMGTQRMSWFFDSGMLQVLGSGRFFFGHGIPGDRKVRYVKARKNGSRDSQPTGRFRCYGFIVPAASSFLIMAQSQRARMRGK
jgi:hypothetical protein